MKGSSTYEEEGLNKQWWLVVGAVALTMPGIVLRLAGLHPAPPVAAFLFGLAIVGAAFMLAWGAEVAQEDIPRALALTVLALIAVLPEYAVDMVFAWQAASDPERYGPLALANMTGANRLLIGVGWPLVVFVYWWRSRRAGRRVEGITLDQGQRVELVFLALATLYSFIIPLKGQLDLFDLVVLVIIFGLYAYRVSKSEHVEPELIGPAKVIGELPDTQRRVATVLLFLFSGAAIFLVAHEFAEALIDTGEQFGINERLLVQWLAPLASEAPEFIITALFAWRLMAAASLGALVSSKVNQWTLLVGTIPLVFNLATMWLGNAVPTSLQLDGVQRLDLLLTSAQSLFAVAIIANLTMNVREALLVFGLFMAQFLFSGFEAYDQLAQVVVTGIYFALTLFLVLRDRSIVQGLVGAFRSSAHTTP